MALLFKDRNKQRRAPLEDPEEYRLTLVEHLEELRDRIIRSLFILGGAWVVGWQVLPHIYGFMTERVVKEITRVLGPTAWKGETFLHAPDGFLLWVKLSFFIGLVPAFPLVVLQLWGFIEPALKPSEREPVRRIAPFSLVLFAIGATFAWFIMPQAFGWMVTFVQGFPGVGVTQEAGTLAFFIIKTMLAFGIAFQLPLVVYIMGAIGLLKAETLFQYWRQAATAIFIISMIITPSNDPATMLMMAIPMVILFIISVYAVKITERRRSKRELIQSAEDDLE